ncbi:MAG TPA: CDP-alcohol phosphatidyltransferase family protein, partial [Vicinamibacteria bacterium]|nr:CDP-alcohol phosphatidyltransferase family protein [Vicinamibacteria bacterium]
LMQRAERLVLTALGCLLDPALSAALGRPEGTVLSWVLLVIALGAFATAVHRTAWIARRLRR